MDKALIIRMLEQANGTILRTVHAMPTDKLEWQPMNSGRPALHLLKECAQTPGLLARTLEERSTDWYNEQVEAEIEREQNTLFSIEACETLMHMNTSRLIAAIQGFPEEEADKQVTLPFGAGGDHTLGELLLGNYWNTTYHEGQINYIQTLYGDREMH